MITIFAILAKLSRFMHSELVAVPGCIAIILSHDEENQINRFSPRATPSWHGFRVNTDSYSASAAPCRDGLQVISLS